MRLAAALSLFLSLAALSPASAALVLGNLNDYNQNFDFLADSGSNVTWNNNAATQTVNGSPGWYWQHVGTSVGYDTGFPGGNIGANEGSRYAFNFTGSTTDNAMGSFNADGQNTNAAWGIVFQNNSGIGIASITVSFFAEQYRLGSASAPDTMTFSYMQSSSNITDFVPGSGAVPTGWTQESTLNFTHLQSGITNFGIDGNLAANRQAKSATINVNVPVGQYLAIRWHDGNVAGNDAGMGIDDLTVSFAAIPEVSSFWMLALVCGVAGLNFSLRRWPRKRPAAA